MRLSFSDKVKSVVRKIPKGSVLTYKEVAKRAGSSRAFRAVGNIMKMNLDRNVPCHRVIRSDSKVGNYNRGGPKAKLRLLRMENAKI